MKHDTIRKVVQVEQHFVSLSRQDLARYLSTEDNEIDDRDLYITVAVGKDAEGLFSAHQILRIMKNKLNEKDDDGEEIGAGIPDDAEVTISLGWRREVEVGPGQVPAHRPAPTQQAFHAPQPPSMFDPNAVGDHPSCKTCSATPDLEGPTPDCQDKHGCARVRAHRGNLPVPQALEPGDAPMIGGGGILPGGLGGPGHGTQKLTNRDTGEQVFAARDGMPYGVGYQYKKN